MGTQEIDTGDRYFNIYGLRCHARISGAGPPLVLIHGLGGPLMWQRISDLLAEYFQVIVIDLPGFGDSDSPEGNCSTEKNADFIIQCIEQLRCGRVNVCGISFGGQIAATMASGHRANVDKLILIASTGLMDQPLLLRNEILWATSKKIIKNTFLRSEMLMCRMGARSFYYIHNRPTDLCSQFFIQLCRNGNREAWLNALHNAFSEKQAFLRSLSSIDTPTLIIWGENDDTVSSHFAEEFHSAIVGSDVIRYGECGHSVPLEKPEELTGDIVKFCKCTFR
jgi:pimeloyl-ACP methyl ester carboxylesterase